MKEQELLYTLALQHVPKIGDITAKKLIAHCGSAEAVFKEQRKNLLKIDGIGLVIIEGLFDKSHLEAAENELRFIRNHHIDVYYFDEVGYPERLKHCLDGPILIFQRGNININNQPIISIVGTRKITTKGVAFCEALISQLKVYNPIIISGFAYGTDITAQNAAVNQNLQTIGCLAHGLNQIYPKVHNKYVAKVEAYGGFMTDFWSTAGFHRNNFLRRNRIIAGLSEATIVIESGEKGGSLVTADIANSYNREVFAVPGRPTDKQSIGCNNLIKCQKAHLLSHPLDIPYILNWKLEDTALADVKQKPVVQRQLFVDLDDNEKAIYKTLQANGKMVLDEIAMDCNMRTYTVASGLLSLELKGVLRPLPGKQFELL